MQIYIFMKSSFASILKIGYCLFSIIATKNPISLGALGRIVVVIGHFNIALWDVIW